MTRTTITDIPTNDLVYVQHENGEFTVEPAEAIVLGREIISHALTLIAPDWDFTVDIRLAVDV